jgi:hypothetical protein
LSATVRVGWPTVWPTVNETIETKMDDVTTKATAAIVSS